MFSRESRRSRRSGRDRIRPSIAPATLESLEARELLAYNPLGFSLPDLEVTGFASTAAAWGGNLTVTVNVSNTGASTTPEPLNQAVGAISQADAPATTVEVFASTSKKSFKHAVDLGSVAIPALAQNSVTQQTGTLVLPSQPAGFPGDGGKVYLYFQVNPTNAILESDLSNNISAPVALAIEAPFPELAATALDVPPTMQPGDTIQPNIRIANFGTTDTDLQGPVTVELVASTTPTFNVGSSIVATYTIANIPSISDTSSPVAVFSDANITPAANVYTIVGAPVTLPASPGKYYLGVVVDPSNQIKEIGKVPQYTEPKNPFTLSHLVKTVPGLPPAGVVFAGGVSDVPTFPYALGQLSVGGSLNQTTFPAQLDPTTTATVTNTTTNDNLNTSPLLSSITTTSGPNTTSPIATRTAAINILYPGNNPGNGLPTSLHLVSRRRVSSGSTTVTNSSTSSLTGRTV